MDNKKKRKYINGTKGVISLLLAILMLPFVTIAGALVNAARINSSIAIFDEALCNASNSVLGTYDTFLRDRFGLMALSQDTSSGGTKYGTISTSYSAEDLVSDIFTYYMQENVGILSNTYETTDIEAIGVYPLSDTNVLMSSVLQASKITVPTKIVIDGLSLDDLLKSATKGLNIFSNIASGVTNGMKVADDIADFNDKKDSFKDEVSTCKSKVTAFDSAYEDFSDAVNDYNNNIDDISSYQAAANTAQANMNYYDGLMDGAGTKITSLEEKIERKQEEIDEVEDDNSLSDSDKESKIAALEAEKEALEEEKEDIEEENKTYLSAYNTAVSNYNTAISKLEAASGKVESLRGAVVDACTEYYNATIELRDQTQKTGAAAIALKSAADSIVSDSVSTVQDVTSTIVTAKTNSNKAQSKALEEENKQIDAKITEAKESEDWDSVSRYTQIEGENTSAVNQLSKDNLNAQNIETLTKAGEGMVKTTNSALNKLSNMELGTAYDTIYSELSTLASDLVTYNNNIPSTGSFGKCEATESYEYTYTAPLKAEDVDSMVEELEDSIEKNTGVALLKALVGFVKALVNIESVYSGKLTATIDSDLYKNQGGLPSSKTYTTTKSPYEESDEVLSEEYKKILNSYSDTPVYSSESTMGNIFDDIVSCVNSISDDLSPFKLSKAPDLFSNFEKLINLLTGNSITKLFEDMVSSLYSKLLLTGYVTYNTANRTTYTKSALTGAKYSLPDSDATEGYCFAGAETEYILVGSTSEIENQSAVFGELFIMRVFFDILPVVSDATVESLAAPCTAFFGIGEILVYIFFILAEALADTILLVNGVEIPIVKTYVFVTPTGFPKLLEKFFSLKISEATQKTFYEKAAGIMDANQTGLRADSFIDAKSKWESAEKSTTQTMFSMDYTKSLMVLMLLMTSKEKMLKRLADIIQMEASYNSNVANRNKGKGTYEFDLNNSFTFIRASGSFESDLFMEISDATGITSTERIIYRGY